MFLILLIAGLQGCARPDHIATFRGPDSRMFYTVETFNGSGPVDPDFMRVYAHLQHGNRSDKTLVMDGGYLDISQVAWTGPSDVQVCLRSGTVHTFHEIVKLSAGGSSATIHTHINNHCATP